MELTHRFTVPAPIEDAWAAFADLEMVAGCFPGAALTDVEGDEFKGTVKVKLGPVALQYAGAGTFLERDDTAHRFVMEAQGKDKRGNGTAGATVTAVLSPASPDSTDAEVVTDLTITGKPAQFGRGVIQDVSDKLLGQFIDCLETKLRGEEEAAPEAPPAAAPAEAAPAQAAPEQVAPAAAGEERVAPATPPPPRAEPEALDLGATVLPILLKTYWKQLAAGLLVLLVLRRLLRRRR
jgi:uncharacterized protein